MIESERAGAHPPGRAPRLSPLSASELRLQSDAVPLRVYFHEPSAAIERVHRQIPLGPHGEYLRRAATALRPYATADPDGANAFFLPIRLISYQFAAAVPERFGGVAPDPRGYVESLPFVDRGAQLLFASGDFGQRRRSSYESTAQGRAYPAIYDWLDERFILLAFESTDDLLAQDVALLPYSMTQRRRLLRREWAPPVPPAPRERDLLYSFAGQIAYPQLPAHHIRGGRLGPLVGRGADWFVGSALDARHAYGRRGGSDVAMIARSVFTLCPAGFGRWTFRFPQALHFGSIPIVVADGYRLPFSRYIDWDTLVVRVAESDVAALPDVVRAIPRDRIAAYQRSIAAHAHLFTDDGVHRLMALELGDRLG